MDSLHVLIVDDDPDISAFIKFRLAHDASHFTITCVDSGKDCLEFISTNEVDCILSDYQMPDMDGIELLQRIREQGGDIPFIFITGQGNEELAREAFKQGAFDYFTKEIGFAHFTRIINSIEQAVRQRQAEKLKSKIIEENRLAEEKISKQLSAMEASMDGMAISDRQGNYTYLNRAHAEVYGYSHPQELIGRSWRVLYDEKETARIEQEVMPRLMKEGRWRGESMGKRKDGSLFPQEISLAMLEDGWIVCIVRDITVRKELEQQKADLYAMITHDLRSPLTAIQGYTLMILENAQNNLDPDTVGMLHNIHGSSKKIINMMEDFLMLSQLESGKPSSRQDRADVAEVLAEIDREFAVTAASRKMSFIIETEPGLPEAAIDRNFLFRAVYNLVRNAFCYTVDGGSVTLSASLTVEENRRSIRITVSDTGAGIPDEERERIFEKFYRCAAVRANGLKGSGLGLYIVKAVVETYGGRVTLTSSVGRGSSFTLYIPAA